MPTPTEIAVIVDGPVGTITLDRPQALNAITPTMLGELNQAADDLAKDPDVRVVVLTGRGRAFSAGVDLKALGTQALEGGKVGDILDLPARRFTEALSSMPKPVIAAVNGFCFTGALELVLACDLAVVAEEAKLGDTHARWGLRPTWGMSQRLPRAVGIARARELSYTARTFTGREAVEYGLAVRAVPAEGLEAAVAELVAELLPNSGESFVAYKDLYRAAGREGLAAGLAYEYGAEFPFTDTNERLADFR